MSHIIDGLALSQKIKLDLRKEILEKNLTPQLAVILVGDDEASKLYVNLKEKACKEIGIEFHSYLLPQTTTQNKLNEVIEFINKDETIDALLLQLPLPKHLDEDLAVSLIDPKKDVDGFGPKSLELYFKNTPIVEPGLSLGIKNLIELANQDLKNKKGLIIANNEIFSKPLITMLNNIGVQAKFIKPDDVNLNIESKESDVIIIAIGKKWFLTKDMVKNDAILIDVGTNREDSKTYGDVNPDVDEITKFRSPVPGGVGPMTVAMLLYNTVKLHKQKNVV